MKIAEDEPGEVVEDMVQAGDDQQPVQHAIHKESEGAEAENDVAGDVHAVREIAGAPRPITAARSRA